ncbi:Ig-like domain-containing protein [Acidaminobacter hydrogenoformans]|uniref:Lysophospholipase L1 n=1 Tax=Acidaminobacter hydrogenoformans DSM 2784 TaxID=1120920 RepID=A0A1G5RXC3_9FIRM|nr:Ig-like domain-containing protein [Acidaminobacter hydrogenoformans]SCZ78785.1 Lysophospholipase L1 [Acidaminobacter hydrogenoformans DSM 2784]
MKAASILKRSAALLLLTLLVLMTIATPSLAAKPEKPPTENVPPVIIQGETLPIETEVDQSITFTLNATDKERKEMLWETTGGPSHGVVTLTELTDSRGKSSAEVTYTPTVGYSGSDAFTVTVYDNLGATDSIAISVTITGAVGPNAPPELGTIGNQTTDELATLTFTATATDSENDPLTFSLSSSAPSGASIGSTSGLFTWTPTEAQGPGSFTFDVIVSDGTDTASETVTVTVTEVNTAPVLNDIPDQTAFVGVSLSLTATASDADLPANSLTYSLTSGSVGSINAETGAFSWTPAVAGTYNTSIEVSDGSLTSTDTFTIIVTESSTGPTEIRYVSLGDSIATGTTTPLTSPTNPYVDQFEGYLNSIYDIPVYRSAFETDGDRTNELLSDLKTNTTIRNAVDAADVITISIGGNNLMQSCKTWLGYDFFNPDIEEANQGYADFVSQYDDIMRELRLLNEDATVIVMTLYNPYNTADTYMHNLVDGYYFKSDGSGMNDLILEYADDFNYQVADAFTAFDAYSNGQMGEVTFMYPASWLRNPHPTQFGQNMLFNLHQVAYETQ